MVKSLVSKELRILRRQINQANRRLALANLPGKVKPGSQNLEDRTVRLILDHDDDGNEILSPPVRWPQQGAGRLKIHSVPADNEQMKLDSPSGTIGEGSIAAWSTYDDDNTPPSDKDYQAVIQFEDGSTFTIENKQTRLSADNVHVDANNVTLGGEGGKQVARVGDKVSVGGGSSAGLWPIVTGSSQVTAT